MELQNLVQMALKTAGAVCVAAVVLSCKPPTEIPVPDAAGSDLCPDGYVYIPEGAFEMGMNPDDPIPAGLQIQYEGDMGPRRTVILSAFCIQKTEVTVASFRSCRKAGKCTAEIRDHATVGFCNYSEEQIDRDQHPMNCITRQGAREYCQQMESGDLPSDAQWEKAARGTDQRIFPWGNDPINCTRANFDANGPVDGEGHGDGNGCEHELGTWEVGTLPSAGDSPYGLKDMAGNVEELVLECYYDVSAPCREEPCVDPVQVCDGDDSYATRGGSARDYVVTLLTVVTHSGQLPLSPQVGFRCVCPINAP